MLEFVCWNLCVGIRVLQLVYWNLCSGSDPTIAFFLRVTDSTRVRFYVCVVLGFCNSVSRILWKGLSWEAGGVGAESREEVWAQ